MLKLDDGGLWRVVLIPGAYEEPIQIKKNTSWIKACEEASRCRKENPGKAVLVLPQDKRI